MNRFSRAAAVLAVPFAAAAFGHATLETPQASAGGYHKAVIRVPHGCEGSPTLKVRVRIPDGVVSVKPQPKPGWEVVIIREPLAQPYTDSHGRRISEQVTEVAWNGGRLLDEHYDEFAMQLKLPDEPGRVLYFPTVQECEQGVQRWIEIPEAGKTAKDYAKPAPQLTLTPKTP